MFVLPSFGSSISLQIRTKWKKSSKYFPLDLVVRAAFLMKHISKFSFKRPHSRRSHCLCYPWVSMKPIWQFTSCWNCETLENKITKYVGVSTLLKKKARCYDISKLPYHLLIMRNKSFLKRTMSMVLLEHHIYTQHTIECGSFLTAAMLFLLMFFFWINF